MRRAMPQCPLRFLQFTGSPCVVPKWRPAVCCSQWKHRRIASAPVEGEDPGERTEGRAGRRLAREDAVQGSAVPCRRVLTGDRASAGDANCQVGRALVTMSARTGHCRARGSPSWTDRSTRSSLSWTPGRGKGASVTGRSRRCGALIHCSADFSWRSPGRAETWGSDAPRLAPTSGRCPALRDSNIRRRNNRLRRFSSRAVCVRIRWGESAGSHPVTWRTPGPSDEPHAERDGSEQETS